MGNGNQPLYTAEPVLMFGSSYRPLPETWAAALVHAWVDTSQGLPAEAYMRFADANHLLLEKTRVAIGTPARVAAVTSSHRARATLFSGEVTSVETEMDTATGAYTVIRAKDRGHRLHRGRQVTAYADVSIPDVVRKVAARAGLRAGTIDADRSRMPYLAQPNVTDWEFLQHLAHQQGLIVTVDDRTLHMKKPAPARPAPAPSSHADASPFVLCYGENLRSLKVALSSTGQVANVEVRGWNSHDKRSVHSTAPAGDTPQLSVGVTPGKAGKAFGSSPKLLVSSRPYTAERDTRAAARALANTVAGSMADLEAVVTGTPQLKAGVAVTLAKVGTPFTGKYTATACRHNFASHEGYTTQVRVSAAPPPPVPPPAPLCAPGLAIGIVTDIKEPQKGQHGWVRLKLPWLSDSFVTDWVRTLQHGGTGGGGVISPEVNDEVLVGFEHGRLDRPYILGGLYNGKDAPTKHGEIPLVDGSTGKINRRSIASRDGDRVEIFSVAKGPQGVRLTTNDEEISVALDRHTKTLTIDAGKEGTLILRGGTVKIEAGESYKKEEKVEADQKLTITGHEVSVTASKKDGPGTLDLTAHGKDGGALTMKADGGDGSKLTIDSGDINVTAKKEQAAGNLALTAHGKDGGTLTMKADGKSGHLSAMAQQIDLTADENGKGELNVVAAKKVDVKVEKTDGVFSVAAGKEITLTAAKTNIMHLTDTTTELTGLKDFKVLETLKLEENKSVNITASTVTVKASDTTKIEGGKAEIAPSGDVTIKGSKVKITGPTEIN